MQIVERIKDTAAKQGYTLSDLEHTLGFGARTIYKWDNNAPSVEKVLAVANFLRVSLNWLVTGKNYNTETPEPFLQKYNNLPPKDKERINHYIEICESDRMNLHSPSSTAEQKHLPIIGCAEYADFIYVMGDNSMSPLYSSNEHLYVKHGDRLKNGDIGIVFYNHCILCRQYIESDQEVILRPINPDYPELVFSKKDKTTLIPIGKVLSQ